MNKATLSHTASEIDEAISSYNNQIRPTGTLPAQVVLSASCNPITPKVVITWTFKDDNALGIMIRRKKSRMPEHVYDGDFVCDKKYGESTIFEDTNYDSTVGSINNPATYYYRAFPYNKNNQYQTQYQASIELGMKKVKVFFLPDGTTIGDFADDVLLDTVTNQNLIKIYFGRWGTSASAVKDLVWSVKHIDRTNNNAHLVLKNSIMGNVAYDAAENSWSESTYNTGNARWAYSNVRQFLNATGAQGEWYTPAHEHDHATSYSFSGYDGFLHYFTEGERDLIKTQTRRLYLATNPYGGGTETVDDDVFLLNTKEYGMEPNSDESGPVYDGFPTNADRAWPCTVWTSTIYQHNSYSQLWLCSSAGALYVGNYNYATNAYNGGSVRAGLVIPLSTLLQFDAEASALEGCDVYRVVTI